MNFDKLSIRWSSRLCASQTGNHTIFVNSDGGIRFRVRDQLLVYRLSAAGPTMTLIPSANLTAMPS